MKHGVPQDGHTGQGAQKATARLTLGSNEDSPQEKGMGRETIPERGTAPAEAGDRAQHRGWGCKQLEAETSPWGHLARALGEWEVTAAGAQSGRASAVAAVGPVPRAGAPSPATPPTGPDTGFQRTRPRGHAPPEFTRIIQEACKSPDPECAQHGGR